MTKKRIAKYAQAAGGWGALASTAKHLIKSENLANNIRNLLKTNQDHGFDCPGCAWGENREQGHFKFCENGAKAVNWEATSKRVTAEFFQHHSVSELKLQDGYFLESQGRLSEPLTYNSDTDRYESISWADAFELIAGTLNGLANPNQAEFYTSGRTSNEAAFLYQLFVRMYGSNNFPDCSNMCHEATGVALTASIGVGKGTVTLDDFEYADAIFVFGQNPGSNHPRMLDTLYQASRRGAQIITFNTLKERGLERFANPQDKVEMVTHGSTPISSVYFTPKLGGDMAAIRGMVKAMVAMDKDNKTTGGAGVFDDGFISEHSQGIERYLEEVENTRWSKIIEQSGLTQGQLEQAAKAHLNADRVICTWAMGLTQHKHSVQTIQELTNLQLLRGQLGKPGAGLCPVRGHSNVQGDRTMGINEKPNKAFLASLERVFGFSPPVEPGHNVVQAIHAMLSGESKVFIGLGGNFAAAAPDTQLTEEALSRCGLTVHIATKLNRTHLVTGKQALILPCLGRTDIDMQASGAQKVTVEDSFSMVHGSAGVVESELGQMLSEPAIIAGIAKATLGEALVDWSEMIADYDNIRDKIAEVIPRFDNFNHQIQQAGGFYLGNPAARHIWNTESQKAEFMTHELPDSIVPQSIYGLTDKPVFVLQTLRSHDQYNTTIYGLDDRYRGVYGQRRVLMMNAEDIALLGLAHLDCVNINSLWPDSKLRQVSDFTLIEYDIPRGNVAAYYPETNPLVPLESVGDLSWTPTSKSIAVEIFK
ncbi:FdhF/YdeP family oxidoreductase [Shewanella sp. D64]|uniref:FdhF/YdeP family oxidoreductase n=1 Tax=unclassified Shewanella TaxID=196818 RepID=UPI0022BA2F96|nr:MULTISPECIES: FdhF/YdeP family oxidoreductase [unclassified Shewanella]MEC4725506.1 FdhF/YdeP family oxidoreductase [Shewanella sp. D64]MEC4738675.1 FdhF/YdeP family oxidoreductase [Shewanella sp. E94]WBJ94972.1 FdhF/YdeP family oxidoreductase [Shewanella sp. MTB7]